MSRLRIIIDPHGNKIADEQAAKESSIVNENSVGDIGQGAIQKALLPLTVSMRILGLYFEKTNKQGTAIHYSRFYSLLVVVIMWLNAIRVFTIFTGNDTLEAVLGKVNNVAWVEVSTVIRTSCYRAIHKGRILEVLQTFSKDMSPRWVKSLRVKVILYVIIAWIYTAFSVVSSAYLSFSNSMFLNIMIAPINTIILNSSHLTIQIVSSLCLVFEFYVTGTIVVSIICIYVLSSIMSQEFNKCTEMLHDIVKDPETAKKNLGMIRRRHQELCRMVDEIDGFICVDNAAYVVGFIGVVILSLYSLIAYPDVQSTPYFMFLTVFWMLSSALGLIVVATGGIMINQSAHKIYERLHDIDSTNLKAETIGQINTFLNRVCGEPIGLTVLRIFVIDRNTILTILGLLITYFLLIIQLSPPSSDNRWNNSTTQEMSTNEPPHTGAINNITANYF